MDLLFNYFFISLPEFYVLSLWGLVLFNHQFSAVKYKTLIMASILALASDIMWNLEFLNDFRVIISVVLIFILYTLIFAIRWKRALFMSVITTFSLLVAEVVIVMIILQFVDYTAIMEELYLKFLVTLAYISPLVIGTIYLSKRKNLLRDWYKEKVEEKKLTYYWATIIILVIVQLIMIIYLNYSYYINSKIHHYESTLFFGIPFISFGLVIVNILLIYFVIKLIGFYTKQEIYLTEVSYNQHLEGLINKLRMERHDYVNEIQTIHGLIQTKMYDHLEEYMSHLVQNIHKGNRVIKIKNIPVSAFLHTKVEQIEANGVKYNIIVDTMDSFEPIKGNDLVKIISNLSDNAYRAVSEDLIENPFVELYWGKEDNWAVIKVSNNGPKIDKKALALIFEQGYTTKKGMENSGYGLYIVKSITQKYKGIIDVVSTDQLTSFIIKLPL